MDGERFNAAADELGIVTELRANRAKYSKYLQRRTNQVFNAPAIRKMVRRVISQQIRAEVDAIVAARIQNFRRELEIVERDTRGPDIKDILNRIVAVTGVSEGDICGPRRTAQYVVARQFACHIFRVARPDLSYPAIGRILGGKDHTSIMHACRQADVRLASEPMSEWLADPRIVTLLDRSSAS